MGRQGGLVLFSSGLRVLAGWKRWKPAPQSLIALTTLETFDGFRARSARQFELSLARMTFWVPRKPCVCLAVCAGLGVLLADHWTLPLTALIAALAAVGAWAIWRPQTAICWIFTGISFMALHTARREGSGARALAQELEGGRRVVQVSGVVWTQPEPPKTWSKRTSARFLLKVESLEISGTKWQPNALMEVHWSGPVPAYGDRVELRASAANISPVRNPGQFDWPAYQRRLGIFSELRARHPSDCKILAHGQGSPAEVLAIRARSWVKRQIEQDLADAPEITSLILSMVLGMKGETSEDVQEQFRKTGTLHLFAVSGLNVAMLGCIIWTLLKPLRIGRAGAALLIIPLLCFYALVTGLSPSCVRATVMGSLLLAAFLCDRPAVALNSLGAAAVAILAWDTDQLFAPGFQFSFALVFVIAILARRIESCARSVAKPDAFLPEPLWSRPQRLTQWCWGGVAATLGVTLAAWLGSLLFMVGYFHLFSISSIVANLLLVPIAFAVLALGLLAVLVSPFSTFLAVLFNNANFACTHVMLWIVKVMALAPGGHFYLEHPRWGGAPEVEFTVCDLEDGGSIHLRSEGKDWLLDSGSEARYLQVVSPYLRSRGVNRLDGFLATHGDAQHIGGAVSLLDELRPRNFIDSQLKDRSPLRRSWHTALSARGIGKSLCRRGDVVQISPLSTLRVLYPPQGMQRRAADDKALVTLLESGTRRVLFMSDSGFATEQWLLEAEPDLRADVIVKGHHAKDLSGTPDFIARVGPRAIICSGLDFSARTDALDAWEKEVVARGVVLFRQDRCGAVQAEFRDGAIELRAFVGGQTFRSRAR